MSLATKLAETASRGTNRPKCTMGLLMTTLDRADLDALTDYLANQNVTATSITTALREEGHRIGQDTVMRHRRGACNCDAS